MTNSILPDLSICIPTYNRAPLLKQELESILKQVSPQQQHELEIVISDNMSDDNTRETVEAFKQRSPVPIIYSRNNENVGFDRNCLKVVSLAQGKYCWILGDDDLVFPGAVARILKEIKQNPQIDMFFGNKEDYDFNFSKKMRSPRILNMKGDRIFDFSKEKIDSYFKINKKLMGLFNFLPLSIFKREKWAAVKGKDKFIGTGYIHVYVFMSLLWAEKRGVLKCLSQKLVKRRWGNDRGLEHLGLYKKVRLDIEAFHLIAEAVFTDPRYVRYIDNLVIKNDGFSWVVRAKIIGGFDFYKKIVPLLLDHYWSYPLFWLKVFPIFFMPSFILMLMRWTYRKIIKGESLGFKDVFSK